MSRKPKTQAQMEREVAQFNERIKVGETVMVINDFQEIEQDKTTSEAQILSGHTPVVMLEKKGMYLLDRVKKDPKRGEAEAQYDNGNPRPGHGEGA